MKRKESIADQMLFKRAHTTSYQLGISIPQEEAEDVADAVAFLMRVGAWVPLNKSEAVCRAILDAAKAKGWRRGDDDQ